MYNVLLHKCALADYTTGNDYNTLLSVLCCFGIRKDIKFVLLYYLIIEGLRAIS